MPCICEFDGFRIYMYAYDHNPPHFHVAVQGQDVQITIDTFTITHGRLRCTERRKLVNWTSKRRNELLANWQRLQQGIEPERIEP